MKQDVITRLEWAFVSVVIVIWCIFAIGSIGRADIEWVLLADGQTHANAKNVAEVVENMKAISLDKCPKDFASAYLAHIAAWEGMAEVERQYAQYNADYNSGSAIFESFLRGMAGDLFGKYNESVAAGSQIQQNYATAQQQIESTFETVEKIARARGAKISKK